MKGKVVFVAGASSGINLGIARRFAAAGAHVAMISRSAGRITAAAAAVADCGAQTLGMAADVRNYGAVKDAFRRTAERFGSIDVVISGAAGNFLAPALAMSANAFKTVVDIDLLGTFNVLHASFEFLARPGASLISISAPQGERPAMFQAHACAAKAGVNMLTRVLAMEWGPAGVRVNAISPGPIAGTEGMARLVGDAVQEQSLRQSIALRSYGSQQDVAEMAMFLCSGGAGYITGAVFNCDGGCSLGDASGDAVAVGVRR